MARVETKRKVTEYVLYLTEREARVLDLVLRSINDQTRDQVSHKLYCALADQLDETGDSRYNDLSYAVGEVPFLYDEESK